jgi:hypothetical protein
MIPLWRCALKEGVTILYCGGHPEQGFRCVDTTPEDLRLAGLEPEPSGRLQFGLRIAAAEQVSVPDQETEKLSLGGLGYHSVETIDVLSNATKQAVKVFGYAGATGKYTLVAP